MAEFAGDNRILDLRDNLNAFTYASGLQSLFGSTRKINRFLLKRSAEGATAVESGNILNGEFVRELARQEQVDF
ncbi:hypothetical protein EZI54_05975 [Marinobacter halodurans]|uniref:Uncharacterized protein n=1 Tax=Marinobacter halodurans TaxID=2528979 RepID=A0ABY1ZMW9_9GAMM|nr:hypothetical protein [Marinobacter halodurans]TBW57591.1 hypothetical protein EZI54_05975 [Marinobacter halodurans]